MSEPSEDEAVTQALALAERIKPMLAGHGGDVQGAVLVELVALHLAGHPAQIRETVLAMHLDGVRKMVPAVERELFGDAGHPGSSA